VTIRDKTRPTKFSLLIISNHIHIQQQRFRFILSKAPKGSILIHINPNP